MRELFHREGVPLADCALALFHFASAALAGGRNQDLRDCGAQFSKAVAVERRELSAKFAAHRRQGPGGRARIRFSRRRPLSMTRRRSDPLQSGPAPKKQSSRRNQRHRQTCRPHLEFLAFANRTRPYSFVHGGIEALGSCSLRCGPLDQRQRKKQHAVRSLAKNAGGLKEAEKVRHETWTERRLRLGLARGSPWR